MSNRAWCVSFLQQRIDSLLHHLFFSRLTLTSDAACTWCTYSCENLCKKIWASSFSAVPGLMEEWVEEGRKGFHGQWEIVTANENRSEDV